MLTLVTTFREASYRVENAVESWLQLQPKPDVVLCGRECEELAQQMGVQCVEVKRSEWGTPLFSDMVRIALKRWPLAMLVNSDIILFQEAWGAAMEAALGCCSHGYRAFLVTGSRTDVRVDGRVDMTQPTQRSALLEHMHRRGRLLPPCGADYFIFTGWTWPYIPPFSIGRCSYDNWAIYDCLKRWVPVIDATRVIHALHQVHPEGVEARTGEEAQHNRQLAVDAWPDWTPWKGWVNQATERL